MAEEIIGPVTGVELAFGGTRWLPPINEIPQEYHSLRNPFNQFASSWFNNGDKWFFASGALVEGRDKADMQEKINQCRAILRSHEPKHEHKIAGVAFLLSQFLKLPPDLQEEVDT